jgi:hypothetical protein
LLIGGFYLLIHAEIWLHCEIERVALTGKFWLQTAFYGGDGGAKTKCRSNLLSWQYWNVYILYTAVLTTVRIHIKIVMFVKFKWLLWYYYIRVKCRKYRWT